MRLISFAVQNYRSISATARLPLRDTLTVLIGPNNEGKSNVLRGLASAMQLVAQLERVELSKQGRIRSSLYLDRIYRWDQDYPIAKQTSTPNGETQFDLEFRLEPAEIEAFRTEVGSSLNGSLPIQLSIGKGAPRFVVRKQGKGGVALSAKAVRIASFLGKRIDFQYIPAIRPASAATEVVENLVSRELGRLAENAEYQEALRKIEELQQPILEAISSSVRDTLKIFLPSVQGVEIRVPREALSRALTRSIDVVVNDGTPTPLTKKGDGVQSLAALSLMRHATQSAQTGKQLILAIEEPESHLHPNAIHQLRDVLQDMATQHQVIVTTHCPLFVDRRDIRGNIIVQNSRADRATSVEQIREMLGVRVSDNLRNAEVVLLVEGENDRTAVGPLLASISPKLAKALESGVLAIDSLAGGANLNYKVAQSRDSMCTVHCLLDNDSEGREAGKKALQAGLLSVTDLTYTTAAGMADSEIEDLFDSSCYVSALVSDFGFLAGSQHFTSIKKKFGLRIQELALQSGKLWDNQISGGVKRRIAELVSASPATALHPVRRGAIDSLVQALEAKLSK
jgi:putative ATP-dependent endonuclease of the OLD family